MDSLGKLGVQMKINEERDYRKSSVKKTRKSSFMKSRKNSIKSIKIISPLKIQKRNIFQ